MDDRSNVLNIFYNDCYYLTKTAIMKKQYLPDST